MDTRLNNEVANVILENLPPNIKSIDYLMETLHISRESAYRRMRSNISFSFEEVALLSEKLKFSVNDIIGIQPNRERISFILQKTLPVTDVQNHFLSVFDGYFSTVKKMYDASRAELLVSSHSLPLSLLTQHESLFKLFYCKWLHQSGIPARTYAEILLSPEINAIRTQFVEKIKNIQNTTFVLGRHLFLPFIREIQYCSKLLSMTGEDINVLKNDLLALLDTFERVVRQGDQTFGVTCNIYVSFMDIEINSSHLNYDEECASQYCIHGINSIVINNENLCTRHKNWFDHLKKSSMLITQSNEIIQMQFLNKQREYIETITEDLLLY
ncbi:hypothetical protein FACS189413_12630 [Bacteroidia bacterium]|nr:hypothetical protein FACS189413_12630 [Bacteroidia bacterium]